MSDNIKENLEYINKKIAIAAEKSGRVREDILLLGVSKTIEVPEIKKAVDAGIDELGENRVQEILEKYEKIENVKWHLIGHLQTNKVKYIIDKVALIHSVDSVRLAEEINKRAYQNGLIMDILLEVNIADEESKFGIKPDELFDIVSKIAEFPNLRIKGLMTVAPFVENGEENRLYFRRMKQLVVDINAKSINNINMEILSMGMTGDYEVAIEEGATLVRIGTGIFGPRFYA